MITVWTQASAEPLFIEPLYLNQRPILSLQKIISAKTTHTIKLWKSSYAIANQTLYFGTLSKQSLPHKWILSESEVEKRARLNLTDSLINKLNPKTKTLVIPQEKIPSSLSSLDWNGKILLINEGAV